LPPVVPDWASRIYRPFFAQIQIEPLNRNGLSVLSLNKKISMEGISAGTGRAYTQGDAAPVALHCTNLDRIFKQYLFLHSITPQQDFRGGHSE